MCPCYLPDWALMTRKRRGRKRRRRGKREKRSEEGRKRRKRRVEGEGRGEGGGQEKNDEEKVLWQMLSTYPTSVATRFCALLTISNILTVRSDEQVASLLP